MEKINKFRKLLDAADNMGCEIVDYQDGEEISRYIYNIVDHDKWRYSDLDDIIYFDDLCDSTPRGYLEWLSQL